MATPAKSVQFRDIVSIVSTYKSMDIPCFAVKQGGAINWKYPRKEVTGNETVEIGAEELLGFLELIEETQSAAIYTLALYEDIPGSRITEKTPVDLSWNFRLQDIPVSYMAGGHEMYSGGTGRLLDEFRKMGARLEQLEKSLGEKQENPLGMIGELMEYEPLQPIIMALGSKIADLLTSASGGKVGELRRVSGVPTGYGNQADRADTEFDMNDPMIRNALFRLSKHLPDLPQALQQLAKLAEQKPAQFNFYVKMLKTMK
jgi:hypothetical protein